MLAHSNRPASSTFVASMDSPLKLSVYKQHPKYTKAFLTICPPVQKQNLLKLVLPLT